MVEQFIRFLRQQEPLPAQSHYPTVPTQASSLDGWTDLLTEGCGGDALADTESVYDRV
jgi:hypothetical protein